MFDVSDRVLWIFICVEHAVVYLDNSCRRESASIFTVVGCYLKRIIAAYLYISPIFEELRRRVSKKTKLAQLEQILVQHQVNPFPVFAKSHEIRLRQFKCASVED